jgi:hypothetical protein
MMSRKPKQQLEKAAHHEAELDRLAWQRASGTVVPGDPELTAWYESDEFAEEVLKDTSKAQYGEEAAAAGRADLEMALGGPDMLERALSGRGRPTVGATHANGRSPHRQVRFDTQLDRQLTSYAQEHNLTISCVIRQAVAEWLAPRVDAPRPTTA